MSSMLADRVQRTVELWNAGKVDRVVTEPLKNWQRQITFVRDKGVAVFEHGDFLHRHLRQRAQPRNLRTRNLSR